MTKVIYVLAVGLAFVFSCCQSRKPHEDMPAAVVAPVPQEALRPVVPKGPPVTQSDYWQFIVNNAYRSADEYSQARNPASTFACLKKKADFVKQVAGEHEGHYLLHIICEHGGNTSFASLLPKFDINTPADNLDDESQLWKVVAAKYNGVEY